MSDDLNISREKFKEIVRKHSITIINGDDLENAFHVVWELLCAEVDATKEKEPYATNYFDRMESALYEIHSAGHDFCELYEEVMEH